jgi:hypothetical protein
VAIRGTHAALFELLVQVRCALLEQRDQRALERRLRGRHLAAVRCRVGDPGRVCLQARQPEIGHVDRAILANQQRVMEHVLELADVAGPGMLEQLVGRRWRQRRVLDPEPVAIQSQEVLGQRQDVGLAFPQRCERERRHVQAIVEVLAKAPGQDRFLEPHVARRDQAHVHRQRRA